MGEALLSAVLPTLFEKLASPVIKELGKLYGVDDEIAKLRRTVERIQAMFHDAAEQKQQVRAGHQTELWLREVRRAFYAADDLVDEFEYEGLRRKDRAAEGRHVAGAGSCLAISLMMMSAGKLCKLCSCLTPRAVYFRCQMARKVDDLRRKLDEISKEKIDLELGGTSKENPTSEVNGGPPAETTALLATQQVFGREEVKNKLVELLLSTPTPSTTSSSSSLLPVHPTNFSVISIVGMGGLGKTTLAQLVYSTEKVINHFSTRIWVCVSQDFNLKKLTKQILEHLVDTQSNIPSRDSLNVLQHDLLEKLKGKRFLLILDDVWEEDQTKWKSFSAPLVEGGTGSKILITTRNTNVADILKPNKIELPILSFEESWSLFKTNAFTLQAHSSKYQILEPIGKDIVDKLNGVPLAVAVIGGLLGSETDERKWRDVLHSKLWEQGGHGILPALKLSYQFLPYHLKNCFTYCCVWPNTRNFTIHDLVQLWMAQGYVRTQEHRSVHHVGVDYAKELVNRSLLQVIDGSYVIHDLLRDLGQQILEQEYYTIRPDQVVQEIPGGADYKVHLFVSYDEAPERMSTQVLCKFKSLRTLAFWPHSVPFQLPVDLFHMVKGLRVFDLSNSSIDALPDSIGYLKHLRYLDLSRTYIECLPETLCTLYNLQTLRLEGCGRLRVLPSGMSSLVNLHYLEARAGLVSKVTQIGKLIHLQNLDVFSVSEKKKNRLEDLKNLRELHGCSLCIENLERVTSTGIDKVAEATILKNMQHLETLKLQWMPGGQNVGQRSNIYNLAVVESIIECLQPPQQLKALTVRSYAGTKFPRWMNDINVSLPSLGTLHLHDCTNLNYHHFLPLRQLHSLKTLKISGCPQLKELPQLPPALENLILRDLGLVALPNRLHHLPLCSLDLCRLPEIKQLPLLPFTLRELAMDGVGLQALPNIDDEEDKSSGDHFREPVLSVLLIEACPRLTTLDVGMLKQYQLRHLRVLIIKDCEELVNWPEGEVFQCTLHSLAEELCIEGCPKLTALPGGTKLHPSLKKLVVKGSHMVLKNQLGQLHNVEDVSVEMHYPELEQCASEALHHIRAVDLLEIKYYNIQADGPPVGAESPVVFLYHRVWDRDYILGDKYRARKAVVRILGRRRGGGRRDAAADGGVGTVGSTDDNEGEEHRGRHDHNYDDQYNYYCWPTEEVLQRCLGGHPWTSSLPHLVFTGIPGRELIISRRRDAPHADHLNIPPLPSLQQLEFDGCREMRKLPIEMLLSDTTVLKRLLIWFCPELTWPSVDAGIRSLPSLEELEILGCPKLLLKIVSPSSSPDQGMKSNDSGVVINREDVRSSPTGAAAGLPCLRRVIVDDLKLLTPWLSVDHNILTSLRDLRLLCSELASLTEPAEEWQVLRTLAPSLRRLEILHCPNLENLPADMRGLLPNLKLLRIDKCPKLRHLPAVGMLPASLDLLNISNCPKMEEELANSRLQMADLCRSIPVFVINDAYKSGSFTKLAELTAAHPEFLPWWYY